MGTPLLLPQLGKGPKRSRNIGDGGNTPQAAAGGSLGCWQAVRGCSEEILHIISPVAQDTGHLLQKTAWKTQPEPTSKTPKAACAILRSTSLPSRGDLSSPGITRTPGTLLLVVKHGSGFNRHHSGSVGAQPLRLPLLIAGA